MNRLDVDYAVIPCAGKGTRFLPITKGIAKEMLPIVDKPTVDYIVQECLDAGIHNIIFIVNEGKNEIKKYYSPDEEFVEELKESNKKEFADEVEAISKKANFYYVIQKELLGLGHAVLQAKEIIKDNNFVVCCGDDVVLYEDKSPIFNMVQAFKNVGGKTIVGGKRVGIDEIVHYASMNIEKQIDENTWKINGIIEKPKKEEVASDLASLGKWVFNANIFEELENTKKGINGEIQLTDAIAQLINKEDVYFYNFNGVRYDCGSKVGYITAIIDVALKREDTKAAITEHIKQLKLFE